MRRLRAVSRCRKRLGLDREKGECEWRGDCVGHPLGATGTRLVITLFMSCGGEEEVWAGNGLHRAAGRGCDDCGESEAEFTTRHGDTERTFRSS